MDKIASFDRISPRLTMDYREELKEKYEILRALWVLLKSPVSAYNNNLFGS